MTKRHLLPLLAAFFNPTVNAEVLPVLNLRIPDVAATTAKSAQTLDLNTWFGTEAIDSQVVRLTSTFTSGGQPVVLDFALFSSRAPATRANFLSYVNSGAYTNMFMHRSVPGFVLQGGGFYYDDPSTSLLPISTSPPVVNEFGISNTQRTIAMAKLGGNPDSATSQFFINLGANSDNLDTQNGGFTVFACVTKGTWGNAQAFANPNIFPTTSYFSYIDSAFTDLPYFYTFTDPNTQFLPDYLEIFTSATLVPLPTGQAGTSTALTYSVVSNSNPALLTATSSSNNLDLSYITGATGTATLTVRATDSVGNTVDDTFVVTRTPATYASWKAEVFSPTQQTDAAISSPLADPNHDGITNLEAFIHGFANAFTNHTRPVHFDGFQTPPSDLPQFSFPVRTDIQGISYTLQRSTNLTSGSWATVPHTVTNQSTAANINTLTIQPAASQPAASAAFYRIAFTLTP